MSASADLQNLIAAKLAASFTDTVGDGAATSFVLTHNFGTKALYLEVRAGNSAGALKVNGTHYTVALTSDDTITLTAIGGAPAVDAWWVKLTLLRVNATAMGAGYVEGSVPVVARREKDRGNNIEAAMGKKTGLCLYVMPPLPQGFAQGNPFVFFDKVEVRVRIIEQHAMNAFGVDAYELLDDIAQALHWQAFGTILGHPLQLAARPCEMVEDRDTRIIDVIFEAIYGLQPATTPTA